MKAWMAALTLAACGGSGGDDDNTPMDSAGPNVTVVSPCTGESATITSLATRFDPMSVTITAGQIVKMIAEPTGTDDHDIKPAVSGNTDAAIDVPSGQTKCFRFNNPGTYNFRCSIHSFVGSVVVN